MSSKTKNIIILALLLFSIYLLVNRPVINEVKENKVIEEKIVIVKDTIQTEIKSKPIVRYINSENVVIHDTVHIDTSLTKVNEYNEELVNQFVKANIKVLTNGELKGLSGEFEVKEKTKTITITRDNYIIKSNLYLGSVFESNNNLNKFDIRITADYTIRNKHIIKAGYSPFSKYFYLGFGFKL